MLKSSHPGAKMKQISKRYLDTLPKFISWVILCTCIEPSMFIINENSFHSFSIVISVQLLVHGYVNNRNIRIIFMFLKFIFIIVAYFLLQASNNKWLTVPNILTFGRLLVSPYIGYLVLCEEFLWALGLVFLAAVTDSVSVVL